MQGQSSANSSLMESLSLDHGSVPLETGTDQQICWNNVRNSAPSMLSDYVPPNNTGSAYINTIVSDGQNFRAWSMGEPSSSVAPSQISHNEQKAEHSWASTTRAYSAGQRLENLHHVLAGGLSSNNINSSGNQIASGPLFMPSSSSNSISQDLNINAASEREGVDNCPIVEHPLVFRSGLENLRIPNRSSSSNPSNVLSGTYVEGSDGRPSFTADGHRLSRKRKATEENVGQSSGSGSSNYFQHAESSVWRAPRNSGNSLTISTPSENTNAVNQSDQVNPRLGLEVGCVSSETSPDLNEVGSSEISHRNLRLRINYSHQHESLPVGTGGRSSSSSSPHQASGLIAHTNTLSPPVTDANSQVLSRLAHVPSMRRNSHSSRWTRSSSSRGGSTSSSPIEGDAASPGESRSRSMSRRLAQPLARALSGVRDSSQSPNDSNSTGGNAASSTQGGSALGSRQGSGLNLFPEPLRWSELVHRSLFPTSSHESGGQNSNIFPLHSLTSNFDQAMPLPSDGQGRRSSHSRSAMLLDRHHDSASGMSHSHRTLAAASSRRSRLVSEQLQDVFDLMSRGESLTFEDVMILDQSVFGTSHHHDRHRDMRLDVDNMSYEELLALEERIGNVNTGVREETISSGLKQSKYAVSTTTNLQELEPCCICQDEYKDRENLGELKCGHGFHTECIKQWLKRKNLCPICKTTAIRGKEKA